MYVEKNMLFMFLGETKIDLLFVKGGWVCQKIIIGIFPIKGPRHLTFITLRGNLAT